MSRPPRLSIGLPVHDGGRFLAASLDALLGQTFGDFELILADNASTDDTAEIGRAYAAADPRVRYIRHPTNIGSSPNHNFVAAVARAGLFKWASYDDLYARDLLESCIGLLDEHPEVVLAHSWTATIDADDDVVRTNVYRLSTAAPSAPERFHSVLVDEGGDDYYGVVRTDVLRRVLPQGSFHHSDRTLVAALSLQGPFRQVPDWRYFRRDHPEQAERACPTVRTRCTNMDPRRGDRLRHPTMRLYGECLYAYVAGIRRAPLSVDDRLRCYRHLASWSASRAGGIGRRDRHGTVLAVQPWPAPALAAVTLSAVARREAQAS